MKVVVLFDGISALGKSPDLAILETVEAVEAALGADGHEAVRIEPGWAVRIDGWLPGDVREIDGSDGTLGSDDTDAPDSDVVPTRERIFDFSPSLSSSISPASAGARRWPRAGAHSRESGRALGRACTPSQT
jgi:hypothetical protein